MMTQRDFENGQMLNFRAAAGFEHGAEVVTGVGAIPAVSPRPGLFSSTNIAGTLTTGVSWVRLGIALVPLLFSGKKKKGK